MSKQPTYTVEQVLELAPDSYTARVSKSLTRRNHWRTRGQTKRALWGIFMVSPTRTHDVFIDLTAPAFSCDCTARKKPCKHSLSLLLSWIERPTSFAHFPHVGAPDTVKKWLDKRDRAEAKRLAPATPEMIEAREEAATNRLNTIREGLSDLDRWLTDLMRTGLAIAQSHPPTFWTDMAQRLIDAQAATLAKRLTNIATLDTNSDAWSAFVLSELAHLHLLIQGYQQYESLPEPMQADLRTAVGWIAKPHGLHALPVVRDTWAVVGRHIEKEKQSQRQETWLWGQTSQRGALVLDYARKGGSLEKKLMPGTLIDADFAYFPSNAPLQGAITAQYSDTVPIDAPFGKDTVAEAIGEYALALSNNPWIDKFPLTLNGIVPIVYNEHRYIRDSAGDLLPIDAKFKHWWLLLSLSGGATPLTIFGTWDSDLFRPMGLFRDSWLHLGRMKGIK